MTDKRIPPREVELEPPASEQLGHQALAKLDKHWWHYPQLVRLNISLLCALLGQATVGFDGSMLNGLQAVSSWTKYFDQPAGQRLGTMSNGFAFGNIITIFFSHWLCERFGRRWPLFGSSIVIVIGTAIQAASQTFAMFVVARFIVGMGSGILSVVSFSSSPKSPILRTGG
jgi:MFS family permease